MNIAPGAGTLTLHDVLRRHGVILDWGTGELMEKSTRQYRETLQQRASVHWS